VLTFAKRRAQMAGAFGEDRSRTALYASGRESRAVLNALVQQGLKAEGVLVPRASSSPDWKACI
jgi:hypothetical protein